MRHRFLPSGTARFLAFVALSAIASACSSSSEGPETNPPAKTPTGDGGTSDGSADSGPPTPAAICSQQAASASDVAALVSGETAFAADFYVPAVSAAGASGNVLVSSYSAAASLMMVGAGAAGETATQMQTALHLPTPAASIASSYAGVTCEDETQGNGYGNSLVVANAVWAQKGETFETPFLSALSGGFDAALQQTDFSTSPTAATTAINTWVSKETSGQIPMLLSPNDVTMDTRLVLVDVMDFKGVWATGFDPSATSPSSFTLEDGSTKQVPTMSGTVSYGESDTDAMEVIELPYKGDNLVMDFLLPGDQTTSLATFEATLTSTVLTSTFAKPLSYSASMLDVPKFSFSTTVGLVPVLQGLGMTGAFMAHVADFSGIDGMQDLYISFVVQDAHITVDESGTVAAVATATGVSTAEVAEEPTMINRPFVFLIRDVKSGSILFMGHVTDPSQG